MNYISDKLKRVFDDLSDEFSIRNDYSGRFMYGAKCFAITTRSGGQAGELFSAILCGVQCVNADMTGETEMLDAYVDLLNELSDLFSNMCQDQMGLGMVDYFPGYQLVEDDETDEEDEEEN